MSNEFENLDQIYCLDISSDVTRRNRKSGWSASSVTTREDSRIDSPLSSEIYGSHLDECGLQYFNVVNDGSNKASYTLEPQSDQSLRRSVLYPEHFDNYEDVDPLQITRYMNIGSDFNYSNAVIKRNSNKRVASRVCTVLGCTKSGRGASKRCIAHGGGIRCLIEGCTRSGLGKSSRCAKHGGGRRCVYAQCTKGGVGSMRLCISHGGGRRCSASGCTKSSRGNTGFCIAHAKEDTRPQIYQIDSSQRLPYNNVSSEMQYDQHDFIDHFPMQNSNNQNSTTGFDTNYSQFPDQYGVNLFEYQDSSRIGTDVFAAGNLDRMHASWMYNQPGYMQYTGDPRAARPVYHEGLYPEIDNDLDFSAFDDYTDIMSVLNGSYRNNG